MHRDIARLEHHADRARLFARAGVARYSLSENDVVAAQPWDLLMEIVDILIATSSINAYILFFWAYQNTFFGISLYPFSVLCKLIYFSAGLASVAVNLS